ncbi:MAG: Gfo/Idh/MocA family protein [Paracoccaceae bacterium]
MTKPINWGILGASNFALNNMGPAIHEALDAQLVALATSSPEKAEPFKRFCPDLRVHNSYDALLADPEIEAVYIPLPNQLHVEWTKKAMQAGKHVLTEKPIALKAEEIDDLIAMRDATGLLAAEAYMIVHHPQWQRAKALLAEGAIGKLLHVDGFFSYFNTDMDNIRNRPETGGGGIRDIGVYTYGSARYVTGEEPVRITNTNIIWENRVDTTTHMAADFDSFTYTATTSMRMATRQEMNFHGTEAVMRIPAPFNADLIGETRVEIHKSDGTHIIERFPGTRQYKLQVEAFGRSVRDGVAYEWTLENARGTQRMLDMVFEADAGK